jgi:hypothetical protein
MAPLCRSTGTRYEAESSPKPEEKIMLVYF